MKKRSWIFLLLTIAGLWGSCRERKATQQVPSAQEVKEQLIAANRKVSATEGERIENYIKRHGWEMVSTGTGLRYYIYRPGDGDSIRVRDEVQVQYEVALLTGKVCYKSEDGKSESLVVGHDTVESGVHEALTYMRVGDRAKLIVPSHLAHGLLGDGHLIPPHASLVIDIEVFSKR